MLSKDVFQVFWIQRCALARMEEGAKKYGTFDAESDTRDLFQEMEDELLDLMNYAAMMAIQVRAMRAKYVENRREGGQISTSPEL